MSSLRMPRRFLAASVLALAGACLYLGLSHPGPAAGQDSSSTAAIEAEWKKKNLSYDQAATCKGCHTMPGSDYVKAGAFDVSLLTEYAIWKVHDKHAQAYAVLVGNRGKEIGRQLGKDILKPEAGCLGCHAMYNVWEYNRELKVNVPEVAFQDGVSCGGCHGPSSEWRGTHDKKAAWRDKYKTDEAKEKEGFRNLRDPAKRAELCMSCHIGHAGEGKVVTHAMMAAGHPPLPPIEMATFSKNEPKHWRDPRDVPAFKDWKDLKQQETRFALIGSVVAIRETLELARDRGRPDSVNPKRAYPELLLNKDWDNLPSEAELRKEVPTRWPELAVAHSDCFSCHHDLRSPSFRQTRGFGYHVPGLTMHRVFPGRPLIRTWPLAALRPAAQFAGKEAALDELGKRLADLAQKTSARPFGKYDDLAASADQVAKWIDDVLMPALKTADFSRESCRKLLDHLVGLFEVKEKKGPPAIPDFETARVIASLINVVASDLELDKDMAVAGTLKELKDQLDLEPYGQRSARVKELLEVIRTAANVPPAKEKEFNNDKDNFEKYLAHIGDTRFLQETVLQNSFDNYFLSRLRDGVANVDFTNAIDKKANRLQDLSDIEQRKVLKAVADYDPDRFLGQLKTLRDALNKK